MGKERLLSLQEAAEEIQRHPNTLRNWIQKGLLPAQKVGKYGNYRIKLEDLKKTITYVPARNVE